MLKAYDQVQEFIITYSWKTYGFEVFEAFRSWTECLHTARRKQLQKLELARFGSWTGCPTDDYDTAMWDRSEAAKRCDLDTFVKRRLPEEDYQAFQMEFSSIGLDEFDDSKLFDYLDMIESC